MTKAHMRKSGAPGKQVEPAANPIVKNEFAACMNALGPFEDQPTVALAVSGGADSMTLACLTADWAHQRGGRVIALTVDHGLRPASSAEAKQVGHWLGTLGVEHHILRWRGPKPDTGIQAAAREARYGLLTGWCRRRGIFHLNLAHHRDDQAETLLLRLGKGSGVDGLSAMSPATVVEGVRLLRPLLGFSKARLVATLESRNQCWVEDPSNTAEQFARTKVRRLLSGSGEAAVLSAAALAATANRMALARGALESWVTDLLVVSTRLNSAGFALVEAQVLLAAPDEIALRALARLLMCVGGGSYPPRFERLQRMLNALRDGGSAGGRTLAGCRIMPWRGRLLVCREAVRGSAGRGPVLVLKGGGGGLWDGRFKVRLSPNNKSGAEHSKKFEVRCLGRGGWRELADAGEMEPDAAMPAAARHSLPALWHRTRLLSVPHLGYESRYFARRKGYFRAEFAPKQPLTRDGAFAALSPTN